jgi:hypothetical protein
MYHSSVPDHDDGDASLSAELRGAATPIELSCDETSTDSMGVHRFLAFRYFHWHL